MIAIKRLFALMNIASAGVDWMDDVREICPKALAEMRDIIKELEHSNSNPEKLAYWRGEYRTLEEWGQRNIKVEP